MYDNRRKNKHFYSSEPRHCILGQFAAYWAPRVNIPCDTIDTDYRFYLLKNMLCGSVKMSGKESDIQEIYWEFIHQQMPHSKEKQTEGPCKQACQNATTVSHFTPSKNWCLANLHLHVFAQIQSNIKVLTQFQDSKRNTNQYFSCN